MTVIIHLMVTKTQLNINSNNQKKMKEFKDTLIHDNVHYFLLGYLHDTAFEPIYRRKLEKYDENTGRPQFTTEWLTKDQVFELLAEAIEYYKKNTKEITLENIEKYLTK